MFLCILLLISFAVSPALSAVAKDRINSCSASEFTCSDGTCISFSLICNTNRDCSDGLDEAICNGASSSLLAEDAVLHERFKRRISPKCGTGHWQCRDGTCITFDGKCDGKIDCADKSDETEALCRTSKCQPNWFQCTYGACVDGTAPCNGIVDCADHSDELLPICKNKNIMRGMFQCQDGSTIPVADYCDGFPDCPDDSDETLHACKDKKCAPNLFKCAYGACVEQLTDCNKQNETADPTYDLEDKLLPAIKLRTLFNKDV